jgi:membrane protein required for colicin V production
MPITWFDLLLIVIMLISAFLAMVRGFMREFFSIVSWLTAAVAGVYFAGRLAPSVKSFVNVGDTPALIIAGVGTFLVVLLVVAVITIRISDMVLDSQIGALDRTLGFIFGLVRGFLLVAVAYTFVSWLISEPAQNGGIRNAKSVIVLKATRDWFLGILPDNFESIILKLKPRRPGDTETPAAPSDQHGQLGNPADKLADAGYDRGDRIGMPSVVEALKVAR